MHVLSEMLSSFVFDVAGRSFMMKSGAKLICVLKVDSNKCNAVSHDNVCS